MWEEKQIYISHIFSPTDWGSAVIIVLAGKKEEHLNMLEGGIIAKLLEEKWTTFAQAGHFPPP